MTCKDCFHYDACTQKDSKYKMYDILGRRSYYFPTAEKCGSFKEKSKIIELPCKVGAEVHTTYPEWENARIVYFVIENIEKQSGGIICCMKNHKGHNRTFNTQEFGKTIFLSDESYYSKEGKMERTCETCKHHHKGYDITMSEECGGCCTSNDKWESKESE